MVPPPAEPPLGGAPFGVFLAPVSGGFGAPNSAGKNRQKKGTFFSGALPVLAQTEINDFFFIYAIQNNNIFSSFVKFFTKFCEKLLKKTSCFLNITPKRTKNYIFFDFSGKKRINQAFFSPGCIFFKYRQDGCKGSIPLPPFKKIRIILKAELTEQV
jgi:hypothetical protein